MFSDNIYNCFIIIQKRVQKWWYVSIFNNTVFLIFYNRNHPSNRWSKCFIIYLKYIFSFLKWYFSFIVRIENQLFTTRKYSSFTLSFCVKKFFFSYVVFSLKVQVWICFSCNFWNTYIIIIHHWIKYEQFRKYIPRLLGTKHIFFWTDGIDAKFYCLFFIRLHRKKLRTGSIYL